MTIISECPENFLAIYCSGQDFHEQTINTADYLLCGQLPEGFAVRPIVSDSSRMVLLFRSGYSYDIHNDFEQYSDWPSSETVFGFEATIHFFPALINTTTSTTIATTKKITGE